MNASHPLWTHIFTPALKGESELVCRRYRFVQTDGAGYALSARALLAIEQYELSAQALYKGLAFKNPNAHVLAIQIGLYRSTSVTRTLMRLSDDLKHLLDLHDLSNLNAAEAVKKINSLTT